MRDKLQLDIYTMLIIAIVPVFLAVAWGLTWNYERATARQACEDTESYLADAAEAAPLFTGAGVVDDVTEWMSRLETITPKGHADDLHEAATSTVEYAMTTQGDLPTDVPAVLYEEITPFRTSIDEAYDKIAEKCPELLPMIPDAFPMFFTREP